MKLICLLEFHFPPVLVNLIEDYTREYTWLEEFKTMYLNRRVKYYNSKYSYLQSNNKLSRRVDVLYDFYEETIKKPSRRRFFWISNTKRSGNYDYRPIHDKWTWD